MPPNIALVGRMAAGKTTLANLLMVKHNYRRVSHADGIKAMAVKAYGPIDKSAQYAVTTREGDAASLSGREILQGIGQAVKYMDRDFWVKSTLREAHNLLNTMPIVNDDTRFVFEADALRNDGWVLVRVVTPDEVRMQRYEQVYGRRPTPQELSHESEREIDDIECDYRVSGTDEPWSAMDNLVKELTLDGIWP